MLGVMAYIPFVNRPDLLKAAVASVPELNIIVIDNSKDGFDDHSTCTYRPLVPMTFTQSHNWMAAMARRTGATFYVWMHSDCTAHKGTAKGLVAKARELTESGAKWGVLYTHYDTLSAVNLACVDDIGGYDTTFSAYFSDNDFYHRMDLAGWERINTGLECDHVGSQTINSDPELKFMNSVTFEWYRMYYQRKWGGNPGEERFTVPFNRKRER